MFVSQSKREIIVYHAKNVKMKTLFITTVSIKMYGCNLRRKMSVMNRFMYENALLKNIIFSK